MIAALIVVLFLSANSIYAVNDYNSPWHYVCNGGNCEKREITPNDTSPQSLSVCQLFCGSSGAFWPMPTGHVSLGNFVVQLNYRDIDTSGIRRRNDVGKLLKANVAKLKKNVQKLNQGKKNGGQGLVINFNVADVNPSEIKLTLQTNESYTLTIQQQDRNKLNATITALNYFGARHAIETLSQLIVYDDLNEEIRIVRDAHVVDEPAYVYRGILLDTSRNFVDKPTILRTIEAMGMSKLNTFHWHITDSHSFPYVSKTWPLFSKYGAYSSRKVYSNDDVKEIIDFGLLNGVRVLPEFDAPAHVGEGWQWVGDNATVCFKAEPWRSFCVEPPCGQLNPTSDKVYEVLEGIYKDMIDDFEPDIFHMGGDEVSVSCWKSVGFINDWMTAQGWGLNDTDYYKLWSYFQTKAYEKLNKANGDKAIPAILWTSGLTNEENLKYLDPEKYIIQVWTRGNDPTIKRLLDNNFKIIISNYDKLYLDCGYGAWIGDGNNWCSPYKGWQLIYTNSPIGLVGNKEYSDLHKDQILGGEATLWSEQVEGSAVDSKLWPRSAAMAERLWSEPGFSWQHAESRFLWHRERMVERGILSDAQKPEWCVQNQGSCY